MGLRSDALYNAIQKDLEPYRFGYTPIDKLPPGLTYKPFAANLLLGTLLKKWVPKDTKDADRAAYDKFQAANNRCSKWELTLESESDRLLFGEFLREIDNFLHPDGACLVDSFDHLIDLGRCGPGASIGCDYGNAYAKLYSSKMATTSLNLYCKYKDNCDMIPMTREAERQRRVEWGIPTIVDSSRSSFVPKTSSISRMICVEPSLNMLFQLGLGTILENRLRQRFDINLETQPDKNRRLARIGSLTGIYSTIDLESASDCISVNLCKEIFPTWFFELLMDLRSPNTKFSDDTVALNMISTMGNGFTFPLQTMIFSCLVRACYKLEDLPLFYSHGNSWACFGDDIICNTKVFRNVSRLLTILGFTANSSKTFSEGPFRESCGADWFYGQPVRGVYLTTLDSPQDIHVAVNLLNNWSAYTGIPLKEGIRCLLSMLRGLFTPIPYEDNIDSGIRVPLALLDRLGYKLVSDNNGSILYRSYVSKPKCITIGEDGFYYPKGVKRKLSYNPSGLLLSLLNGELVRCKLMVRQPSVNYSKKMRCTPRWDYNPLDRLTNGYSLSWRQWETAVATNM